MKKIVLIVSLIAVVFCSSWRGVPEPVSVNSNPSINTLPVASFSYFRTHKLGNNGVKAHWAMTSTSGITEFIVQRTYEDPYDPYSPWDDLCNIPCGNNKLYKHDDTGLFPGYVSYRVVALNNGTPVVVSEISTIQILQQ